MVQQDRSESLSAAVSGAELMRNVRALARWVKLSGTPEERESFNYVRGCMDALGFRTTLLEHPAYISLPGAARVMVDGKSIRCITHSHSRSSPPNGVTGKLVDIGKASKSAFEGRDLKGCILLLDGIARPEDAQLSTLAGAVGQVHVTPDGQLHEMCVSPVWGSPSQQSRNQMPTTVVTTVARADGLALRERLALGEEPKIVLHAAVDTGWRPTPLLVAELDAPGAPERSPFVMFSGHLDTWHYGVMDNGTANATMMEVARLSVKRRDKWRRGLRLCFWSGHSHGRYSGSTWYADAYWHELEERCVAHINVDSTGGMGATVLTNSGSAAELRDLAAEVIGTHTNQVYGGKRIGRQGDESFWGIGLPAMFGSLSHQPPPDDKAAAHLHLGWWWHTPEDTLDKIDEANLVRDTKVFADVIWRFLANPVLPVNHVVLADDLLSELKKIAPLGERFSLAPLVQHAWSMREKAAALASHVDTMSDLPADLERVNRALMRVSRAIVPMDSTTGDRFDHDPAVPQPHWPTLQPLRDLAAVAPGSDDWHFREVSAVRASNRVVHALRQANTALDEALSALAGP